MLTEMTWDEAHATNSELEEMGVSFCECKDTFLEYDDQNRPYEMCGDCGSAAPLAYTMRSDQQW